MCSQSDPLITECPLPPFSELLKNSKIRETDSFVICVQIHSPVGPFYPQQPSVAYVPQNLLDGLEASLDNSSKDQLISTLSFCSDKPFRHRGCPIHLPGKERPKRNRPSIPRPGSGKFAINSFLIHARVFVFLVS